MNKRSLIGMCVVVGLLMGCGSAAPPGSATLPNQDVQAPDQAQNTSPAGMVPDQAQDTSPAEAIPDSNPVGEADSASEIAQPAPTVDIHCTETDPHPIAQSIAETYQTTYEEVMTFFCTGVEFEDIVMGYQTAELSGRDIKEVLTLWYDFGSWEDVWQELGLE